MSELYQLPDGWEWKKLIDVCEFINGRAYKKEELLNEGKYPVLRVGNFFTNNNWYYSNLELPDNKYCENGDLLYAWSASFGPKIWNGEKAIYHYHIWKLIPNDKLVTKKFMYQLLDWDVDKIKSDQGTGTTMIHITKGSIEARKVPIPPLPEQQRIVSKLDALFEKIDKAIALHVKNMEEADAFMGSVLNDVFGELEEKYGLQSILEGIYIGCKRGFNPTVKDGKVPFIGMSDIDEHNGVNTNYVMEDYKKVSSGKTKFEKNAVLVGKIFPCTQNNKTSIVPSDIDGGFATTEVYALHSMDNMNPFYLNNYIRSKEINDYMVSTMVGATGRQRVPSETIKSIQIPIPPLFIQQKVVTYLDEISQKIEKIKQVQKEKLSSLKALKASILDQAFRGEL